MFTFLHISDLHRASDDPVSNDELISSLLVDMSQAKSETPPIPVPDAIVVSGDLVQGVSVGDSAYPTELSKQYDVALDLLVKLADRFVGGDHSRVIIIPGNHDVDWTASRKAMERESTVPPDVYDLVTTPRTPYRWSWPEQALYQIADQRLYDARFDSFRRLLVGFYGESGLRQGIDANRDWNLFELDNGRIAIAAFNSCQQNDCFSNAGVILPDAVAAAHIDILDRGAEYRLLMAVWHHSVEGIPGRSDFLSSDTIRLMINKGFRLGLHGHQHRADASPYGIQVSGEQRMVVVSAGSLCAGRRQLPTGASRQYNVVTIRDDYAGARVHVRETTLPGIFSAGRFPALGGKGFVDVEWTPRPSPLVPPTQPDRESNVIKRAIVGAETLVKTGKFAEAVNVLGPIADNLPPFGRKLLLEAVSRFEMWTEARKYFDQPRNAEELTLLVRANVMKGEYALADQRLRRHGDAAGLSSVGRGELADWIAAQQKLRP